MGYKISFTGYRESKLPFHGENDPLLAEYKERLYQRIVEMIKQGAELFFSGMALGIDTYAAEAVLKARKDHPDIQLIAVIPCPEQDSQWSDAQQKHYRDILSQCDQIITVSPQYDKGCMHRRNRTLVEMCDYLFAVYDGKPGGTEYTIKYAHKLGRPVIMFPPN